MDPSQSKLLARCRGTANRIRFEAVAMANLGMSIDEPIEETERRILDMGLSAWSQEFGNEQETEA